LTIGSDAHVGRHESDDEDLRPSDLAFPDATALASQFANPTRPGTITVLFSTYKSIGVVVAVRQQGELGLIDLVIGDEAPRTVVQGSKAAEAIPSYFTQVHDNRYRQAKKCLYMTATPWTYSDKRDAHATISGYPHR